MHKETRPSDYELLIRRLKSPANADLYRECSLHSSDSKEGNALWSYMQNLHLLHETLQTQTGDEAFLTETTMKSKIKEIHKLLDRLGWKKEE